MIKMFQANVPPVFTPRSNRWITGKNRKLFPPPHIGSARPLANTLLLVWLAIPHFRLHDRTRPLHFMGFRCAIASQTNGLGAGSAATAAELTMTCRTDQVMLTDVRPLPTRFVMPHNQTFSEHSTAIWGWSIGRYEIGVDFTPWQNCSAGQRHHGIYLLTTPKNHV